MVVRILKMEKSKTMLPTDVLTHVSLIPTNPRCDISHWQNFGLLIFAKSGLPVSLFHGLEQEKRYFLKEVNQCQGFGRKVPFVPRKLSLRTTASFVKCNLMVP